MKKLLTSLLTIGGVALLVLSSCKKNDAVVVNSNPKSSALTANVSTLVLDKSMVNDTTSVVKFNFTAPSYSYKAIYNNVLEIDADGDNWKNPTSAALPKNGTHGYSTGDFNTLLLKLNLPAGQASKVNIRVANELSNVVANYSNVVTLTVTPFNLTSWIYIVGQFQGWSTATPDSLISPTGNGIYTGVINFPPQTGGSNHFLILPTKSFSTKYATASGPDTATTSSTYTTEFVTGGGNDFILKNQGGTYLVTINTNSNQLTLVPADSYSLIGNAIPGSNWSVDTQLKYVNDGNDKWVINGLAMTQEAAPNDGFKVRQDNAWTYAWGTSSTDGTLTDNSGVNIGVPAAANYNFVFVMAPSVLGTKPPVTTTYTFTKQ